MSMNKYINAERLKAEIERLKECAESAKKEWVNEGYTHNAFADYCIISSFERLIGFIDSLQQEQATKGYDEAYLNECIAKASKSWKGVDVDKFMDEVRGREQEQPEVDLEKALDEYYKNADFGPSEAIEYEIHKDIARHFYELGKARKEE